MGDNQKEVVLPPGLEFEPTDEELIVYFLCRRAAANPCNPKLIPDLDFYASDPCHLNGKAFGSKKGWYFFSRWKQSSDEKRQTREGFWKDQGLSEPVFTSGNHEIIGIKKYLVYCYGGDDGSCSNWIMNEYHLLKKGHKIDQQNSQMQDITNEWVLCRVCDDNYSSTVNNFEAQDRDVDDGEELSYLDEMFLSMEDDDPDEVSSYRT